MSCLPLNRKFPSKIREDSLTRLSRKRVKREKSDPELENHLKTIEKCQVKKLSVKGCVNIQFRNCSLTYPETIVLVFAKKGSSKNKISARKYSK